ncbi:MAG: ATP-binding protein [Desulfovibrio sp.]|nr:ATP-binding protein [Desulfovibrio sp.]MBI4960754.1 ATP-binding protein [Desulfovibrio sp.]
MTADIARTLTITIPAQLKHVALVGLSVRAISGFELFIQDDAVLIELAVCEALNNAIIHSLKEREGESIELGISLRPGRIGFTIRDRGTHIEDGLNVDQERSREPLATSGRGMAIIHDIMDSVRYERHGEYNVLSMEKQSDNACPNIP